MLTRPPIRSLLRSRATWIILLTLLLTISLVTRLTPYPDEEWSWHGRPPAPSTYSRWWPAILILTILVLLMTWLDRKIESAPFRRQVCLTLILLIVLAPALQISLIYIHNANPLVFYLYRTIGPHNGFWQEATTADDIVQYLRDYPQQMRANPFVHLKVHPPGNVIYIWLWRRAFQTMPGPAADVAHALRQYNCADLGFVGLDDDQIACALAQMVIPFLSGLVVIPVYLLGRKLTSRQNALRAAAFCVLIPALNSFTMRWDQLYPLFLCFALTWLHLGLEKRRAGYYALSGLTISLATFMSVGNLTILPASLLYGLVYLLATDRVNWRRWLANTWKGWGLFLLGTAAVWLAYQAVSGHSFWTIISTIMLTHYDLGRTYWIWVLLNPYDFVTFLGVPAAVLFVTAGWQAWRQALASRGTDVPAGSILALSVTGAMLAMDIAGVARGEVGRMWLLWMPAACLIGAIGLQGTSGRRLYRLTLSLMAFQALIFTLFLRVAQTGMPRYEARQPHMDRPTSHQPLEIQFGDEIALLGYDLASTQIAPGDPLQLTLYWQALDRPDIAYTVFTHLFDEEGQLQGQQDNMPQQNGLPTTCWIAGEVIPDPYEIQLPVDAPPGTYRVEVGLYWLESGERLAASGPDAAWPDRIQLGPIQVKKP